MNLPGRKPWVLSILETPEQMKAVEELQRQVWPGSETEVVPLHMLITFSRNGGLVIGAYNTASPEEIDSPETGGERQAGEMVGFVFGFPGLYFTPDGPRPKHCSHQLGVHPEYRGQGVGFALKRAQWQMVRHQSLDLVTWTFDPLLSRNAHLNITRLGGVSSTYMRDLYGKLEDELNKGTITDRLRVDWWVNSRRVTRRLSRRARRALDLAHYLSAGAEIINPTRMGSQGFALPGSSGDQQGVHSETGLDAIVLVEIPSDFLQMKAAEPELAKEWRQHIRSIFESLFEQGYLVTDFIYLPGTHPRSFYALSHGESTL